MRFRKISCYCKQILTWKGKTFFMAIMNQITGLSFDSSELEHVRNWLVERDLFTTIQCLTEQLNRFQRIGQPIQ